MFAMSLRFFRCLAVCTLACAVVGCNRTAADHSSFAAQVLGREYTVEIDGTGNFHPSGRVTLVKIGEHKLGIEKERLTLDGKECAKIRPDAIRFHVDYSKKTLTVKADGSTVFTTQLTEEAVKPAPPKDPEAKK